MAIPTIAAVGAFNDASTGSLTVSLPAHQADDILLVFHETNVSTGSSTPSGWAHITGSPRSQGANVVAVSILWKRATSSSETNPVFSASSNHQMAFAVAARGCVTAGDPWDFAPVDYGVAATSLSVPGGTTTVTNTRTFVVIANSADILTDQISAVSNGSLTGFAVIDQEFTDMGNGGGVGVWSGTRTTTGSTGTTSATVVSGSSAALVFALVGATATTQALTGTIAVVSDASGAPTLLADMTGTIAAVSGLVGDIGTTSGPQQYPLTGTIAATSTTTGSPAAQLALTGTVAATSSASGTITSRLGLSGVVAATSSATGTIAARLGLTGTVAAVSGTVGNLVAALGLTGVIQAISNLVGDIGGGDDVPLRDLTITATLDPERIAATLDPPRLTASLDPDRLAARMETT